MKSKNTIELNGMHYDTVTGAQIDNSQPATAKRSTIDGFFRSPAQAGANLALTAKKPIVTPTADPDEPLDLHEQSAAPEPQAQRSQTANHVAHHKTQGSATLMRQAVKQPTFGIKKQLSVQSDLPATVPAITAPQKSVYSLDDERVERAKSVERSPHVSRHHTAKAAPLVAPLPVQPVPVKSEATEPADVPAPLPSNKPVDMFEQAMANAGHFIDTKAHNAHFKRLTKRHLATMATGTLALLVIGGFVAYSNSSAFQLKVASIRAGVGSVVMPDFKAAGFKYTGAAPGSDKLTMGFSDANGTYQLTQQSTNWDSQDLISNVGSVDASGFPTYSTVQAGNITVYRLTNNSATWITNGMWYQLSGTGTLSDVQVANLVKNI